ncbi:MAG: GNAT family N-acetyltransferase [Cyanobacteria bacterium P01_B01_bin.77]
MIEIQRLSLDEVERLRAIRLNALQDAPQAFETTFQTAIALPPENWRQQLQRLPTFVAVVDGVDSGMVRGVPHSDGAAYLISLWVAPQARKRGVGQTLIDAVVGWAHSEGVARLILEVGESNGNAIALYTRKGFKPTGQTRNLAPPRDHIKEQEMALEL